MLSTLTFLNRSIDLYDENSLILSNDHYIVF